MTSTAPETSTTPDAKTVAQTYFRAWADGDFDTLATVLADEVTFRGPLGTADGAESCLAGLRGMSRLMTGVDVVQMVADGDDVMTWFELHTEHASPAPTANWSHVENGRIVRIRVAFDPREIIAGG